MPNASPWRSLRKNPTPAGGTCCARSGRPSACHLTPFSCSFVSDEPGNCFVRERGLPKPQRPWASAIRATSPGPSIASWGSRLDATWRDSAHAGKRKTALSFREHCGKSKAKTGETKKDAGPEWAASFGRTFLSAGQRHFVTVPPMWQRTANAERFRRATRQNGTSSRPPRHPSPRRTGSARTRGSCREALRRHRPGHS